MEKKIYCVYAAYHNQPMKFWWAYETMEAAIIGKFTAMHEGMDAEIREEFE